MDSDDGSEPFKVEVRKGPPIAPVQSEQGTDTSDQGPILQEPAYSPPVSSGSLDAASASDAYQLPSPQSTEAALSQGSLAPAQFALPEIPALSFRMSWRRMAGIMLIVVGLAVGLLLVLHNVNASRKQAALNAGLTDQSGRIKTQTVALPGLEQQLHAGTAPVANTLTVNGSVVLAPSPKPSSAVAGQLYYSQALNLMQYFNGVGFINLQGGGNTTNNTYNSFGSVTNVTNVNGGGLSALNAADGRLALFTGANTVGGSLLTQSGSTLTDAGILHLQDNANSTTAFQVEDASGSNLLTADTVNSAIVLGNDGTPSTLTVRGGAANGSNENGADLVVDASNGTGSATSGDIIFQTGVSAEGGIQLDNAAHIEETSNTDISNNFTVGTESGRILIVSLNCGATSMTYDGRSLTKLGSQQSAASVSSGAYIEMWYLLNPPSGTHTLMANVTDCGTSGSGEGTFGAASYYGVSQTSPFDGPAVTATGTVNPSGSSALPITTHNTSQIVVDALATDRNAQNCLSATDTQQTVRWITTTDFFKVACGSDQAAPGGSFTISHDLETSDWSDIAVIINPAVPGSVPLQVISSTTPNAFYNRLDITANGNIGVNNANPQYTLDADGIINSSTALYAPVFDTADANTLSIGQFDATAVAIGNTSNNIQTTVNGTLLVKPTVGNDSTTAFQVENAAGINIVAADTTNDEIVLGSDGANPTATGIRGGAAAGNNLSGANLNIEASDGTGVGGSGNIVFYTAGPVSNPLVTMDSTNGTEAANTGSPITFSHTTGSQTDRVLVVAVDTSTPSSPPPAASVATGVTYNGVALTQLTNQTAPNDNGSVWYMVNPPSGAHSVVVTFSGTAVTRVGIEATTFYNIDQSNPIATFTTNQGVPTSTISTTLNGTDTGEGIFDAIMARADWGTFPSPGAGQTQEYSQGASGEKNVGSFRQGLAGSTTMSWSGTAPSDLNHVVIAFNPEPNLTPDPFSQVLNITQSSTLGIDLGSTENALSTITFGGGADRTIGVDQNPGTGSGHSLTVQAGTGANGNNNGGNLILQGGAATGTGTGGGVIVEPQTDTTTAFQILQKSTSAVLLMGDTKNMVITIAGTSTNFATLAITNAHLESTQTTAPTVGSPINCGSGASATVTAGSTDTTGSFTIITGSGSPATCDTAVAFNKAYGIIPKTVILTPTTAVGGATTLLAGGVSSISSTAFTVQTAPSAPAASTTYSYYYLVVE